MTEPIIRRATEKDIPFIVKAIIESEKSNSDVIPSASLYGISETKFAEILQKMLKTRTRGTEYSLPAYLVAEIDGEVMSTACGWIEEDGDTGSSSSDVRNELIRNSLSITQIKNLRKNMKVGRDMQLPRTPGTLQLESFYTEAKARGKRLIPMILKKHIQDAKEKHPEVTQAEIQIFGNNTSSIKACESLGFEKKSSKKSDHPDILDFYGWNEKILMSKNI